MKRASAWVLIAHLAVGCQITPTTIIDESAEQVLDRLQNAGHPVDATLGEGAVRYLGFEALPEGAYPGDDMTLVHYWVATRAIPEDYRVFVHFLLEGAQGWVPHADHDRVPQSSRWPVNRVIRDEHRVVLPQRLPAEACDVRIGLYRGNHRMSVEGAHDDGSGRVRAGSFGVSGKAIPRPTYRASRLTAPIVLDAAINDAEWGGAPWIDGFTRSDGAAPSATRSRARLAWDEQHLYLAFDLDDPDILGTHTQRDAPVYREEAVEIFIDATGGRRDYVELQLSPLGTQFDAAFTGGPRRNMNTRFDARYRVAVGVDGTVEPPAAPAADRDRGWRSEWAIDAASIPGLKTPLKAGQRMRINLFRVGKDRIGGRLTPDESAWSPPLMGDFHNLERFGELVLAP